MGITPGTESFQNAYFNPDQPTSRVHDWNLTLEKEIMRDTVLRVGYVGNHATNQDSYDDWNQHDAGVHVGDDQEDSVSLGRRIQLRHPADLPKALRQPPGMAQGRLGLVERHHRSNSSAAISKGFGFQVFTDVEHQPGRRRMAGTTTPWFPR